VLAIALVILFDGSTHALIPLFAVGVFLCFTLSQAGMVRHWLAHHGPSWRIKMATNGLGAVTTGTVTAIVVAVKFVEGAWLIAIIVPALILLFVRIHAYYGRAHQELAIDVLPPLRPIIHTILVPVADLNRPAYHTLAYARSLTDCITAVYIADNDEHKARMRQRWDAWGTDIPRWCSTRPTARWSGR